MPQRVLPTLLFACLLAVLPAAAQPYAADGPPATSSVRSLEEGVGIGVGDVGVELLSETAQRAHRRAAEAGASRVQARMAQREAEVTVGEFTHGALVGGAVGAAAGAVVGAVLGGDRNPRWETALPAAFVGLAVGAPTGVYLHTGRSSRYLWGTAGTAGAVLTGSALYYAELR